MLEVIESSTAAEGGVPVSRSCRRFACSRGPAYAVDAKAIVNTTIANPLANPLDNDHLVKCMPAPLNSYPGDARVLRKRSPWFD
jgi:hypothetical protein